MGYKRDVYPERGGDFMKAKDKERSWKETLTIASVDFREFDDGGKLLLSFKESEELLVLNKTNAEVLFDEAGDDTDQWVGTSIRVSIRSTPKGAGFRVTVLGKSQPTPTTSSEDFDDDDDGWED